MELDSHILAQRFLLNSFSIDKINTKAKYTLAKKMGKNPQLSPSSLAITHFLTR